MLPAVEVTLPGGLWIDGVHHRQVELSALSGEDEAFLVDLVDALLPAERTTAVLARCVTQLGSLAEVTPGCVRSLTVGDREALLLHLRRLTFGERLCCVLGCPREECEEKMEVEVDVADLLLPPYPQSSPLHEVEVAGEEGPFSVQLRLPTGADSEAVASLARRDPARAARELGERCVASVRDASGRPVDPWPELLWSELPARLAHLDPQAELNLQLSCPECSAEFTALLDAGEVFLGELAARARRLFREVHALALHYHWSESDILRLSVGRRRRYLELLSESRTRVP